MLAFEYELVVIIEIVIIIACCNDILLSPVTIQLQVAAERLAALNPRLYNFQVGNFEYTEQELHLGQLKGKLCLRCPSSLQTFASCLALLQVSFALACGRLDNLSYTYTDCQVVALIQLDPTELN